VGDATTAGSMLEIAQDLLLDDDVFLERRTQMSRHALAVMGQGKGDKASNARLLATKQHSRARSMKEFAEHRVDDLTREMSLLGASLRSSSTRSSSKSDGDVLCAALPQLLLLGGVEKSGGAAATKLSTSSSISSLSSSSSATSTSTSATSTSISTSSSTTDNALVEQILNALTISSGLNVLSKNNKEATVRQHVHDVLMRSIKNQTIHFHQLLNKNISQVPLKMEICSGNGEWATSCCAEENRLNKNTSMWVTMELRRDRAQRTFSSMMLKGASSNMCVVEGDASNIVKHHVAKTSVDYLFINHPEPPERNSGTAGAEGNHLLDLSFIKLLKNIMKHHGMLTIVTGK